MSTASPLQQCVVIVQHEKNDGPCLLAPFLNDRQIPFCIFEIVPEEEKSVKGATNASSHDDTRSRAYGSTATGVSHESLLPSSVKDRVVAVNVVEAKYPLRPSCPSDITSTTPFPFQLSPVGLAAHNNGEHQSSGTTDGDVASGGAAQYTIGGIIVLGGFMSVNDKLPYFSTIYSLIHTAVGFREEQEEESSERVPVMGICLGCQLLATALGGATVQSENVELGWIGTKSVETSPTEKYQSKPWFASPVEDEASKGAFTIMHTHGEKAQLRGTTTSKGEDVDEDCFLVSTNATCREQAFQYKNQYVVGAQFHIEIDEPKLRYYLAADWPGVVMSQAEHEERKAKGEVLDPSLQSVDEVLDEAKMKDRLTYNQQLFEHFAGVWCQGLTH